MTQHQHDEEENPAQRVDLALWRQLWRYTRPYSGTVRLLGLTAVVVAATEVAFPQVTRRLIDDIVARGSEVELTPYALVYGVLVLVLCAAVFAFIRFAGRLRTHVSHDIRAAGFENLQRLSFSFYDHRPVGWLMARMTSDCERLSNILAWGVLDLVWGLTFTIGVAVAMFVMNPVLALIVLAVLPVLGLVSAWFQKRILRTARAVRKQNSRLTAAYNEGILGVRTSKTFVREAANLREFGGLSTGMYDASVANAVYNALYLPVVLALGSVAVGAALAFGGYGVLGGGLGLGTLIAFIAYARQLFQPVQEIAHWFGEMQMAQASAERILGLIEAEPEVQDSPEVRARIRERLARPSAPDLAEDGLPEAVGEIRLEGVEFAYRDREGEPGPRVLHGVDLSVRPGETIALVGATGGGKSTLVNLVSRFYEPTAGRVLFDGVDYRERSLAWLQSKLGIVLQTPHLFSGTVAENIRYGRLDATQEEIEAAARLVGADAFVRELEKGYGTEVGEGGGRLSTGQKQLVSFARAILADPEILVMDEATSSVDTETEQLIQLALARVLEGRTCFVIAHRLSTVRDADRILVIEEGRIAEAGSHAELMNRRGRYHDLYTQQSLRESALTHTDAN